MTLRAGFVSLCLRGYRAPFLPDGAAAPDIPLILSILLIDVTPAACFLLDQNMLYYVP
jgi:hypothetical protein